MTIEAETIEEAIKKAYDVEPLPTNAEFLSDSFRISTFIGEDILNNADLEILSEFEKELIENGMINEMETK